MGKTKIKTIETEETKPVILSESEGSQTDQPAGEASPAASPSNDKAKKEKVSKRAQKKAQVQTKVRSKKYQEKAQLVDPNQKYSLEEAAKLVSETSYSKFPGTVEAHLGTNAKNMRGLISLPFASGRKLTILAFGKDADKSGADIVGTEETVAEIEKGKLNFDVVVTTPDWMPKLAKAAKILGPRGMMPNPKSGTITDKLEKAVSELQQGKIEYKTQPNSQVIHLAIGKVNQPAEEIAANVKTLYITIGKSKIKKITLSSSMGPGVKVNLTSI